MVKDFVTANNVAQIKKLLRVLGQEFTLSQNQNSRKGGLIGLAATAIALSRVISSSYLVLHVILISVNFCRFFFCTLSIRAFLLAV